MQQSRQVRRFRAPWSKSLILLSALAAGLIVYVLVARLSSSHPFDAIVVLPFGLLIGAVLFTIRGYSVVPGAILVHRLLWATRLPRAGLESANHAAGATRGSLRFGNGGLFAITGWYYNKQLGRYRAFLTDQRRAVVLRYGSRTVVLSPDDPNAFIDELAIPTQTV